jgi:hypothetical protein
MRLNWTALGAIATFLAVLVALWPIWRTRRRERDIAGSLRLRVLTELAALRHSVELRTNPGHMEAPGTFVRETEVRAQILSVLLAEVHLLDATEWSLVHAVHEKLVVQRAIGRLPTADARKLLDLIDQTTQTLGRRRARRRRCRAWLRGLIGQ